MLIFGLYFCYNAKEKQEISKQCKPMNTFMEFLTLLGFGLIVYILQFMSEFFFKHLFIQGKVLLSVPCLLLLRNLPLFIFRHFGDA